MMLLKHTFDAVSPRWTLSRRVPFVCKRGRLGVLTERVDQRQCIECKGTIHGRLQVVSSSCLVSGLRVCKFDQLCRLDRREWPCPYLQVVVTVPRPFSAKGRSVLGVPGPTLEVIIPCPCHGEGLDSATDCNHGLGECDMRGYVERCERGGPLMVLRVELSIARLVLARLCAASCLAIGPVKWRCRCGVSAFCSLTIRFLEKASPKIGLGLCRPTSSAAKT